ncbi:MAG TPA: hypothetical protein VGI64_01250 [Streptosporangiaceae bacterium]|jgi:hypothetical protein
MSDGTAERVSPAPAAADGPLPAPSELRPVGTDLAASAPGLPGLSPAGSRPAGLAALPAEPPVAVSGPPDPGLLAAARLRLASRYRVSDAQTPRELRARLVRDVRAVGAVLAETAGGQAADPLDLADALVLVRSLRSYLDGLEAGLLDGAEQAGLSADRTAACLGVPVTGLHDRRRVLRAGLPG